MTRPADLQQSASRESAVTAQNVLWCGDEELILASASAARRDLLTSAGLVFRAVSAEIDERAHEEAARAAGADAGGIALALAEAKARAVAGRNPQAIVIGCDQVLYHAGEILHKPADRAALTRQITRLSGDSHALHVGMVLVSGESVLAECVDTARLAMRNLTPEQIALYCDLAGDKALASVGGYALEGAGIHLFETVEGAHATILGLPLLPLLAQLRRLGKLAL